MREAYDAKIFTNKACETIGQLGGGQNEMTSLLLGGTKHALSCVV
jgi:hypothetical protein